MLQARAVAVPSHLLIRPPVPLDLLRLDLARSFGRTRSARLRLLRLKLPLLVQSWSLWVHKSLVAPEVLEVPAPSTRSTADRQMRTEGL